MKHYIIYFIVYIYFVEILNVAGIEGTWVIIYIMHKNFYIKYIIIITSQDPSSSNKLWYNRNI